MSISPLLFLFHASDWQIFHPWLNSLVRLVFFIFWCNFKVEGFCFKKLRWEKSIVLPRSSRSVFCLRWSEMGLIGLSVSWHLVLRGVLINQAAGQWEVGSRFPLWGGGVLKHGLLFQPANWRINDVDNLPVPLRSERRSQAWIRQSGPPCMINDDKLDFSFTYAEFKANMGTFYQFTIIYRAEDQTCESRGIRF